VSSSSPLPASPLMHTNQPALPQHDMGACYARYILPPLLPTSTSPDAPAHAMVASSYPDTLDIASTPGWHTTVHAGGQITPRVDETSICVLVSCIMGVFWPSACVCATSPPPLNDTLPRLSAAKSYPGAMK
jgi:hypothetical protein